MRSPAWTVRIGPAIVAAALAPTLLGALFLVTPRPPALGGEAAGGTARALPRATKHEAPAKRPVTLVPPSTPPCTTPWSQATRLPAASAQPVRLEGLVNRRGEQTGRRLSVRSRAGIGIVVSLPADSFATQANGWVIYGMTDGGESEIRAIDPQSGCDVRLANVEGVARGAALSADGKTLYVHRVEARTRDDMGVARMDLASGSSAEAVPPFQADGNFGRVFATTLAWALDGATLAVQSCGGQGCHTRLLDTATGEISPFLGRHGALVGITADHVFAFAAGHERPAALLAIARHDGSVTTVTEEAYDAELGGTAGDPVVRVETSAGWQEVRP